jgi:site-specific DNA recombinase
MSINPYTKRRISLEIQTKRIQAYCNFQEVELIKIYSDAGLSGKSIDGRPSMQQLLEDIQKDNYVVCLDRPWIL